MGGDHDDAGVAAPADTDAGRGIVTGDDAGDGDVAADAGSVAPDAGEDAGSAAAPDAGEDAGSAAPPDAGEDAGPGTAWICDTGSSLVPFCGASALFSPSCYEQFVGFTAATCPTTTVAPCGANLSTGANILCGVPASGTEGFIGYVPTVPGCPLGGALNARGYCSAPCGISGVTPACPQP